MKNTRELKNIVHCYVLEHDGVVVDSDNNYLTLDRMLQSFVKCGYSVIELTQIEQFLKYFITKAQQSFKNWYVALNEYE